MSHDEEVYRDAIAKMKAAAKEVVRIFKNAKLEGGWSVHGLRTLQGRCEEVSL